MQLILASASKGREYLLKQLKIPFEIVRTNLDEEKIVGKSPLETVQLRARLKGESVVEMITRRYPLDARRFLILTADTEVVLDGKLIGKPKDYESAVAMLKMLSGRTHEVVTAVYILSLSPKSPKSLKKLTFDRSFVTFRKLTNDDIKLYLSLTEYTRYTGSYAVIACPQCLRQSIRQLANPNKKFKSHHKNIPYSVGEHGRRASPQNFITKIDGSISNVIGLPMEKIIPILRKTRILT